MMKDKMPNRRQAQMEAVADMTKSAAAGAAKGAVMGAVKSVTKADKAMRPRNEGAARKPGNRTDWTRGWDK